MSGVSQKSFIIFSIQNQMSSTVSFVLNGQSVQVQNPDPSMTLNEWLRTNGYVGTKKACGEGGCGACSVQMKKYDPTFKQTIPVPVNSCLRLLCSMNNTEITTIEGIGSTLTGWIVSKSYTHKNFNYSLKKKKKDWLQSRRGLSKTTVLSVVFVHLDLLWYLKFCNYTVL